jgi:uncharacterized protein YjiS (DUF1127 family)
METRHDRLETPHTFGAFLVRSLRAAWQAVRAYQIRQREALELQRMGALELRDLGLAAQDIDAVIDGSYALDRTRRDRSGCTRAPVAPIFDWHKRPRPGIRGACSSC